MNSATVPLVSVVIPTYNSAKFIPQAIESVLNQTYSKYEIIVVDDGSTDDTTKVLEPFQDKVNYTYQSNQGVAASRNKGIALAQGELIAFLDADDLFLPQKLQRQVSIFLKQPQIGMVVCGWQIANAAGVKIVDVELWHNLPKLDLDAWLYWKPVLPSATMIRRNLLLEVGGFPSATVPVEDVECFLELILQGCEAIWCPQVETIYRQINAESLCRNTLRRVKSLELLHERFYSKVDLPFEVRQSENKVVYANLVWSAWHLYQNGYESEMIDYLRKSLVYSSDSSENISRHWIESFESFETDQDGSGFQLNTYQLSQIDGWQKLITDALATHKPTVSIIIPAYNSAEYLSDAIASVLEQTYTNYEIIVINDGSTDNTDEIVAPYLDQIRYFKQSNQGVSHTRNRGICLARGEYIAFLDADDILMPFKLEQQVEIFINQPEIGIVNSGFRLITEAGQELSDTERWHKIPQLTPEIWLLHKPILPSAMMFRRDWLIKIQGFDSRFFASEDVEMVLRMVAQGCKSAWHRAITVYYRQHQTSATQSNPIKQARNAELMQDSFFARNDLPQSMRSLEKQSRYDFFVWIACVLYQANCIDEMIDYLRKSLKYSPYSWAETIVQWVNSFRNSAELNACSFDAYALSNLPQWQKLIFELRMSKVLNSYANKTSEYQVVSHQPLEKAETKLHSAAYLELGKRLVSENDLEQAIIWLRKAIALEPNQAQYHESLGDALSKQYDLTNAIVSYRLGLRLSPHHKPLQKKLDSVLKLQQHWRELTDYCQELIENSILSDRLKMLMVFPYPPYPSHLGGAAMRMFEQIRYFGSRHHLTVIAFVFDSDDCNIKHQLEQYCDRAFIFKLGTPVAPDQGRSNRQLYNFQTWNMTKALAQLSQVNFDVVSFDFIVAAVYRDLFPHCFTVLNEHNIESKLLTSSGAVDTEDLIDSLVTELSEVKPFADSQSESKLLQAYESENWPKFSLRTVVSQENQQEMNSRCSKGQTLVVKNGINIQETPFVGSYKSQKILYMGTMSYYPNIDGVLYFVSSILPNIWQLNPDLKFCIAGREPPKVIHELASKYPQIEVIANPQDMSVVAAECSLSVVPLRSGSGTRIKILHSMAMGLPVVSTTLGCEGLEVKNQEHILIQDQSPGFAQAVVKLTQDQKLWQQLQINGRQLVETKYDWTAIFSEYEQRLVEIKKLVV